MQVTLLRDVAAEKRAKERAEAPTAKTEEQTKADEAKEKAASKEKTAQKETSKSVWRRKFRPLPETKAVDLFADVIGDSFILFVAGGLILYEYFKSKGKPDVQAEKMAEFNRKLEELEQREKELEETEKKRRAQFETLEKTLEEMKKGSGRMVLLRS
jgi:optic atrophy 3 protein